MTIQDIVIRGGTVKAIYGELIELHWIGQPVIRRGSHVEPTSAGEWTADLSPVGGPLLGPFRCRSEALAAEVAWLRANWLTPNSTR